MNAPGVRTVAFNDETIDTFRTMLQSVNIIVVVLVATAALLSFIVLYNLFNINITERRREIASLKVLGFTARETNSYIFREVLLLAIIGAVIGLVLGIFLEGFVVTTAEVDYVMFGRVIHAWSYGAALILTLIFTCVVMLFMRGKLAVIDMVESLKSVE
jgi:putative ABC transport system permease protein